MIVIFNTNGSICDTEMADYVQQGSVGVNKVQLAYADSSRDGLSAYLIAQRPNGTSVTLPAHMASFLCNGERYEGWEVALGGSFTLYAGVVHCTLNVVDGSNQIQANYPFDVTVNATGNPITGDWDEQINAAQYNSYMAQLSDKAVIKRQASFTGPGQPNVLYLIGSDPYEAYVWDPVEEKYKTLDVGIYVVPDITQADLTPFSNGQIIYSQGVFYEVDSAADDGYKLLNGTGNADENALPYFPTSKTAHEVASNIGRVNLFYTGEDDKMLATIHKRNYEPVCLYALSLSENALYIAEVDNEDKTLATLLSEADKHELATKQFVLSHHLLITHNGQELTQDELDYCQNPNATLIDSDGRVYRKISTNEQQNYIEFMAGDIEKDFDISTYVTEIKFPNRILVNTFRGTADFARENVKIWDSTVTKAQLRFLDTDIKNLAKETKKGMADLYNMVADLSIGNTHWVEDESVGLYASLSATTLPKGLINYVGGMTQKVSQLAEVDGTYTAYGLTATPNVASNTFTISGTSTYTSGATNLYSTYKDKAVKQGHKYIVASNSDNWCLYAFGDISTNTQRLNIATASADGTASFSIRPIDNSYITQGAVIDDEFQGIFADLTEIYGAGNEPTTTSDPRIQWLLSYLDEHPEYDEGSLVNAPVTNILSLDEKGSEANWFLSNLRKTAIVDLGTLNWTKYGNNYISSVANPAPKFVPIDVAMNAVCSSFRVASQYDFEQLGNNVIAMLSSSGNPQFVVYSTDEYADGNAFKSAVSGIYLVYEVAEPLATPTLTPTDILNALGSQYTSYPIPSQIKALDGYGMGIDDTTNNYIDFERKKFVVKDPLYRFTGNEVWHWSGSSNGFWYTYVDEIASVVSGYWLVKTLVSNGIVVRLIKEDNSIRVYADDNEGITDQTDIASIMNSSVSMVYSIETPIETDISEYLDRDFPNENLIDLYQGGEVEFENENDMAVPYLIKYEERIN